MSGTGVTSYLRLALLLGGLLLLCVSSAGGVTCHLCIGTACNDPFQDSASILKCNGTICVKTKTEASGTNAVGRGCVETSASLGCDSASAGGVTATICYCNTELCNGGPASSVVSYGAMLLLMVVAYQLVKY